MKSPLMNSTILALAALSGLAPAQDPAFKITLRPQVEMEFILVPAGKFRQGSPADEVGRADDEPEREVTLNKPYYLAKSEVTVGQWTQFTVETGYKTRSEDGKSGGFTWKADNWIQGADTSWKNLGFTQAATEPVGCIAFADAEAFCTWLSERFGRTFTLPSEAQWEYAARANETAAVPGSPVEDFAWILTNSGDRTHKAATKKPNAWGVVDMLGSQWEWCSDWYAPYGRDAATNPVQTNQNLSDKPRRVLRGGSWTKPSQSARHAARYRNDPRSRNADNGFRVMTSTMTAGPGKAATPAKAEKAAKKSTE